MIPVGDPLKPKAALLQGGFSNLEIRGAYQAWRFIDAALQSEVDRAIMKICRSPQEVFESLEKWHDDPESEMTTQRLYDKFQEFHTSDNSRVNSVVLYNSREWKYHHSVVLYNSPESKVLPLSCVV